MQSGSLKEKLTGYYILCVCEGNAEQAIIDLLLENDKLCFNRNDLVNKACTQIRNGDRLAEEFLNREYEREIVILRILDREKEKLRMSSRFYRQRISAVYEIVTKPEIEILHIVAFGLEQEYRRKKRQNQKLNPSGFCQSQFSERVKSKEFIDCMYSNDIDKLIGAIERHYGNTQHKAYHLKDLLV